MGQDAVGAAIARFLQIIMSEKLKVYIARDVGRSGHAGELFLYPQPKPVFKKLTGCFQESWRAMQMPSDFFLNIKDGECYEAEIVLGEKV